MQCLENIWVIWDQISAQAGLRFVIFLLSAAITVGYMPISAWLKSIILKHILIAYYKPLSLKKSS